ncbi:LacI family DNA-binding transcriptional regulator [Fictibacillus barbaricus]|uniref:DNA-binding LacI/PurR family transcriptional regulator n=1 Tax=Fictibacillus barbaricus TaxID=182136 RepID=A0ABU1TXT5_9BACL|nr:LacI family DNA-binding transcriptional regulator [Fictibacillus barbaricus]MDR7071975.1 DNA-binding LacI/PurR family transcriptional regulator [Fictibacillus barbaricus]
MSVTIKDVAKLADVAPSTVSRVIANNPRISEKTKRKVKEAMDYLGYHPNFNARSLANRSTQAIGLVMPSSADKTMQNPFFPEVIRGISTMAHEQEYALYMSTGNTEEEIFEGVVRMVQGRRVDGIVMLYSRVDDNIMAYLQEQNFPFTVIGKPFKNAEKITHIDNDNFKAAQEMTEYLLSKGHERIGFVGGNLNLVVTIDRLLGYEKAIRKAKLPLKDEYIVHEEFLKEGGQEAIKELLALENPPSALIVMDDLMSFGILHTLNELGLSVPDDISIVSFNNVMLSELSSPSLTSVDINIFQLGYEAAKGLLDCIQSPKHNPKRVTVPYKLVERQSCRTV